MSDEETKRKRVIVQAAPPGSSTFTTLAWQKVKVRKSLDEICHYMELTLPVSEQDKIKKHYKVEIRYENPLITDSSSRRRLTTVMVDEATFTVNSSQKILTVVGRSPARDIIDSSWHGWRTNQESLELTAKAIAERFGIGVHRFERDSPTGPLFSFNWGNESPWARLINEADNQGRVFTSNEAGDLYLWENPHQYELFSLDEGKNIREIQYTQNGAEQFNEYVVKGGGMEKKVFDHTCNNKRIMTISLTDVHISETVLERRALTEMRRRKNDKVTVTVTGWGLSDPQIKLLGDTNLKEIFWNPYFLIPVSIPSLGLSGILLISQVEYTASPSIMTSDITLVNREAYS